jgi:glycogen operon protein
MLDAVSSARQARIEKLLSIVEPGFRVTRGSPLPFGVTLLRNGINFAVFSRHATDVSLVLFRPNDPEPVLELPLDPRRHRTGDVWHTMIEGLEPHVEYGYRMWREPNSRPEIHRFDPAQVLIDPYTRAVAGADGWGSPHNGRRCVVPRDDFDWNYDQPLNIPLADSVIYELNVRGFTAHPSSGVFRPGTFAGLVEKIPYLQELGVTAVELLPVHEFDEGAITNVNPSTGERLRNLWGYQPIAFFAPKSGYASVDRSADAITEFREMVKSFHHAGIEVILDVVFNHTAEGNAHGPTQSFRGIDNVIYYLIDRNTGGYLDYSGTGNTMNCNHPVVREMIRNCLRYWVTEMHVDGFRFDLAAILGRGEDGSVLPNPPLLESLAKDPVLSGTKLIAEAWDAAGLYQVGQFPSWSRWAEWNGRFRDDIRRFVRGDSDMISALATRLCGSPDLYESSQREPYHGINFVTCHDGFTLADLVSYSTKHNEANGEGNRDGADDNYSFNCGVEGPSDNIAITELRARQIRNFLTLLLMANGVPMLLAGDEFGRTQHGNNNAYCQDNETGWVNWDYAERNQDLLDFVRRLIRFRHEHPILRRQGFSAGNVWIHWHGVRLGAPDWSSDSHSLAMHVHGNEDDVYVIANAWSGDLDFELPPGIRWMRTIDTAALDPGFSTAGPVCHVQAHSVVVLAKR